MTKNKKLPAFISIIILMILACARSQNFSTPVATSPSLPAGESTRALTHDGLERKYILYLPGSVNWSQPVPLVFVFHGGTGNARSAVIMSGMNQVADEHGFIVAYPNGTSRISDNILLTWNGGGCCGYAQEKNIDDVGFTRAILKDLQAVANIDPKRVYAAGLSNGGMLSHRLACESSDIFAAIAPVAGTLNFPQCDPANPISVIEFHGTGDQHIPFDGGFGPESLVQVDFASVYDSINFWVAFDKCNSQPQTNSFDDIQHQVWAGCADSTSIELYTIIGGGHAWPGGDTVRSEADLPTQTISASQLMWEFFAAHPKP